MLVGKRRKQEIRDVNSNHSIQLPSSSGQKDDLPFDFISDLPSNLIDEILMRLPLSDAARTSVLSTKWRYLWTKLPQLIFDATFCQNSRGGYKDKLLSSGFVLSLHQAHVLRFALSIPGLLSCPEIDKFIVFLSVNRVEDFTLHISHGSNHKLPSHFFLCHQLKRICLHNCELRPPSSFQGFKKLISLELLDVTFTGVSIVTFISKCPLLKQLTFLSSTFCDIIEINAPNLLYLHIGCTLKFLSLKNVPKLLDLSITSYPEQTVVSRAASYQNASHTQSFLSCLPSLEKLELCYVSLKCLASSNVLGRHPLCRLSRLKELNIWGLSFTAKDEIFSALWLMRNSPNLTSIMLEFDHAFDDWPVLHHNYSGISFEYVHQVCLLGFTGVKPEIQFIQFLLAAAPNLYNFSIKPFPFRGNSKDIILKRIMEFKRASAVVNFKYLPC